MQLLSQLISHFRNSRLCTSCTHIGVYYESYFQKEEQRTGWSYIRLDGEDLKTALRKFHQEGNETYGCSAPKWHRKITTGVQRMHDKTELLRYIKYEGYEPIVFDKIPMEYWT